MRIEEMIYDIELDTTGMTCPQPVLETKKLLSSLSSGQILKVIFIDPSSVVDFHSLIAIADDILLCEEKINDKFYFFIQKH